MSTNVNVPALPESVADATVLSWHKKPGDSVRRDENLVDLETDKVVLEVPATVDGVLGQISAAEGETVLAGDLLCVIESGKGAATAESVAKQTAEEAQSAATAGDEPILTPAVRRLVREMNIDPRKVKGTGKDGRILKSDITTYIDSAESEPAPVKQPAAVLHQESDITQSVMVGDRPEQRVPMTRLRARIAERLLEAQHNAAILTTFNEVNLQAVNELRARYKDKFLKDHEVRLGFMSFFIKAAVEALKSFPLVNATIDGQDIVYHGYYDIGIAVG
ncbi:MAG: 2-oxo acid dehydrogenase subunit E2, partial [Gammaproteobacteria bacterium]|nr:2-oxo acid dehydrogenase subunit E2 [Gammaproteobacteria bacterium]